MSLPEEQRVPITLAYFDGISYRQVAERLRMPEGTVKSRIRAGLQSLGSSLADVASVA
jgi:RNA polymerase sigma-70 factor (ECF subfamily)